jgi:hypothetical protein
MDAKPASTRRYLRFSGASQLASAPDRTAHLQIYAYVPGSRSHSVAGHGQRIAAGHAAQAARPLSHVLILRALRETARIHAHCFAGIPRKNRRNIGREASDGSERAAERSVAKIAVAGGTDAGRGQRPATIGHTPVRIALVARPMSKRYENLHDDRLDLSHCGCHHSAANAFL